MTTSDNVGGASVGRRVAKRAVGVVSLAWVATGCGITPDVVVDAPEELATSEAGAHVDVSVRLSRNPSATVVVRAVSSDPSEGTVSKELYFDPTDWWRAQTITVTGVDDAEPDGDVTYDVSFVVGKTRHHGGEEADEVLTFVNRDDDRVTFDTLGDLPGGGVGSSVADMSTSGDVVVGSAEGSNGAEAVRWTPGHGLVGLGGAPSVANGVSANGALVVGTATDAGVTQQSGASWHADDTTAEFLRPGPLASPGWPMFFFTEPRVALDDGRIYGACIQNGAYGERLGCRYDGPEQITLVAMSVVYAADPAGNLAGTRYGSRHEPIGSLPVLNDRILGYPPRTPCFVPHNCTAEVRDFSENAAVAIGTGKLPPESDDPTGPEEPLLPVGFTYTADAGVARLRDLAGGADETGAYAISSDGTVVAGFGTDESGQQAVVWISGQPLRLRDVLDARGTRVPAGYTLREVRAMSPDARVLAGNGTNAAGQPEGFRVKLLDGLPTP